MRNTWLLSNPYCKDPKKSYGDKPDVQFFHHSGIKQIDEVVNIYPSVAVSVRIFREPGALRKGARTTLTSRTSRGGGARPAAHVFRADFYLANIALWMGIFSLLSIFGAMALMHSEAADRSASRPNLESQQQDGGVEASARPARACTVGISLTLVLTAAAYKFVSKGTESSNTCASGPARMSGHSHAQSVPHCGCGSPDVGPPRELPDPSRPVRERAGASLPHIQTR